MNLSKNLYSMSIREPAGNAILYLADTLHGVGPVEAGSRWSVVGWIESYIRDPADRALHIEMTRLMRDIEALGDTGLRDYYCYVLLDFASADRDLPTWAVFGCMNGEIARPDSARVCISRPCGAKPRFIHQEVWSLVVRKRYCSTRDLNVLQMVSRPIWSAQFSM